MTNKRSECAPDLSSQEILGWKHFPHEADIGVCGYGPQLHHAFEQAALALTAAITERPVDLACHTAIFCNAGDEEALFVSWLNALIYEMDVQGMIFGAYVIRIAGNRLCAAAYGEAIDHKKHEPACEAKGATYTELHVARKENGVWAAQCVIDV